MKNDTRTWSSEQTSIFAWFAGIVGFALRHLVVRARAGTGKTTTILHGIDQAKDGTILLAAFNKRIATELTEKLRNPRAEAKTLHSAGYAVVRRYWENVKLDDQRDADLAREVCGETTPDAILRLVTKLAVRAKDSLPFPTQEGLEALAEEIEAVPDDEWEDDGYDVAYVARYAAAQMARSCMKDGTTGRISFADMVFLPVRNGWAKPRYDLVVIDEAQDMSACQLLLAQRLCRGRLCIVGDDRQAIYGFRGADSGSIDRMKIELDAVELGLTTTYRCPKSVVAHAATIVPDYRAADSAPEGQITTILAGQLVTEAGPGDFVLSRKNAPLAATCLSLLRAGKRARIEGRDIGAGLVAIVRKIKAKSVPEFLTRLSNWQAREIKRAESRKNPQSRIDLVTDQAETLLFLAEGMASVAEIVARIEGLFSDTPAGGAAYEPAIVCSSVHKAKGLEADRVFILKSTLRGGSQEEMNIEYVAVTRAKKHLTWVVDALPAPVPPPAVIEPAPGRTDEAAGFDEAAPFTAAEYQATRAAIDGSWASLSARMDAVDAEDNGGADLYASTALFTTTAGRAAELLGPSHDCDACDYCRGACKVCRVACSHSLIERHGAVVGR